MKISPSLLRVASSWVCLTSPGEPSNASVRRYNLARCNRLPLVCFKFGMGYESCVPRKVGEVPKPWIIEGYIIISVKMYILHPPLQLSSTLICHVPHVTLHQFAQFLQCLLPFLLLAMSRCPGASLQSTRKSFSSIQSNIFYLATMCSGALFGVMPYLMGCARSLSLSSAGKAV